METQAPTELMQHIISLFGRDTRLQPIDLAVRAGRPRERTQAIRLARMLRERFGIRSRIARFDGRAGRCIFLADLKHWLEHGRMKANAARLSPETLHEAEANARRLERQVAYLKSELDRYKKLAAMVHDLRKFMQLYACQCASPCYVVQHEAKTS